MSDEQYYCETCGATLVDELGTLALQVSRWVIAERGSYSVMDFCSYECLRTWAESHCEKAAHHGGRE